MITYNSPRLGNKDIIFSRINIFLGANGTGKSKLLEEIRNSSMNIFSISQKQLIYVEGGRTIKINGSLTKFRTISNCRNCRKYSDEQITARNNR